MKLFGENVLYFETITAHFGPRDVLVYLANRAIVETVIHKVLVAVD